MKTFRRFFGMAVVLMAAALFMTACESELTREDIPYTGPIPLNVEFRIYSFDGGSGLTAIPSTLRFLKFVSGYYATSRAGPTAGELQIGPEILDTSDERFRYDVWILTRVEQTNNVFLRNVGTGYYLSMLDAWSNMESEPDWAWNRPIIRERQSNNYFHWVIQPSDSPYETYFLSPVRQDYRNLSMHLAFEHYSWAANAVSVRGDGARTWGTAQWIFRLVE